MLSTSKIIWLERRPNIPKGPITQITSGLFPVYFRERCIWYYLKVLGYKWVGCGAAGCNYEVTALLIVAMVVKPTIRKAWNLLRLSNQIWSLSANKKRASFWSPFRSLKEMYLGKLVRWWKKRQSRDKYLKNNGGEPGLVAGLMAKYIPKKYKGLFKIESEKINLVDNTSLLDLPECSVIWATFDCEIHAWITRSRCNRWSVGGDGGQNGRSYRSMGW